MKINSWPTAIICLAILAAVCLGIYLERDSLTVRAAVEHVLVALLGIVAGALPQLLTRGEAGAGQVAR